MDRYQYHTLAVLHSLSEQRLIFLVIFYICIDIKGFEANTFTSERYTRKVLKLVAIIISMRVYVSPSQALLMLIKCTVHKTTNNN